MKNSIGLANDLTAGSTVIDECHVWTLTNYGDILTVDNPTSVTKTAFQVPETMYLSQNYPNPFNPTTTISFKVAHPEKIIIELYDEIGKRLFTLINEQKNSGEYSIQFNAASLSSGTYFYHLTTPTTSITKKMIVVK